MKNNEIISGILRTMEKEHINLYHDVPKSEIDNFVLSIKNANQLTDLAFDKKILELFSMFKDAHTSYLVPYISLNYKICFLDNRFYIIDDNRYKEIDTIGGLSTKVLYESLKPLINYETNEWLKVKINSCINNGYYHKMLGLCDESCTEIICKDKTSYLVNFASNKFKNNSKNQNPYKFLILNNNILLFKYTACVEDKNYPLSKFFADIKNAIEENNIRNYILDLRNNGGGNSELLNPFQEIVRNKKLNGVLLINNGVFSSGRFAVARFKKEFDTPLIGEPTGGAAKSFGYNKWLNVEDKKFSVSIKLWDFSDIFGYEGSIQPDLYVPTAISDLENKKDIQLETAENFILNSLPSPKPDLEKV